MTLFKPYLSEWLVRQYLAGWWVFVALILAVILIGIR